MVDPVPTQCMMVDREFPRRPFDRRTGGKKPDLSAYATKMRVPLLRAH
jgi:hypothetical protein